MQSLKKWIGLFAMLAFVISAMPSVSYARTITANGSITAAVEQVQDYDTCDRDFNGGHHDCDHNGKGSCCDKDCQCTNCCGGYAKTLGSGTLPVRSPAFVIAQTGYYEEIADTGLINRIKRPPRA